MSFIQNFWGKVKESPSVLFPSFPINANRILDEDVDLQAFEKDKAYFEIRIKEQFLKKRERILE